MMRIKTIIISLLLCIFALGDGTNATKNEPQYFEDFFRLEVNKAEGYEVRRVNELVFANPAAADTVLAALLDMAPLTKNEKITMYVKPVNGIVLEKSSHAPRTAVEGEEKFMYHFGYVQIDTFFLDVVGFKGRDEEHGKDVKESAKRILKKTGLTNDYKYKYYSPYPEDDKYYKFVITDSAIIMTDKYRW